MGDDRDVPHSKHKKEKHKDRDREREKSRRDSRGERDERHPARKEVVKDEDHPDKLRAKLERREHEKEERERERARSGRDAGVSPALKEESSRKRDRSPVERDDRDVKRRERERERDREHKAKDRDRHRDRDRGRSREADGDRGRDVLRDKDHDRAREREREHKKRVDVPDSRIAEDERHKAKQEEEQAALDDEAERRRKRVQAWQEQKANALAAEEAAALKAANKAKGWSLEDDLDEEDTAAGGVGRTDDMDEDDIDPLDAFMNENAAKASAPPKRPVRKPVDEEELDPLDAFMAQNTTTAGNAAAVKADAVKAEAVTPKQEPDAELDPLDAFMAAEINPVANGPSQAAASSQGTKPQIKQEPLEGAGESEAAAPPAAKQRPSVAQRRRQRPRYYSSESSDEDEDHQEESEEENDAEWAKNTMAGRMSKSDKLGAVDHSKIDYAPFRRNFYIEVQELQKMSEEEVAKYRKELDDIKVRGKDNPKPVKTWTQCGLQTRALEVLRKMKYAKPMPIQAQALPAIMSGRDCIGIAKTGSGKTLAFVLPMLRHIKDQPPLASSDGPIGLIMAPTRELVVQIGKDIRMFTRALDFACVCAYGGSAVGDQISALKRGAEVVVCTPGRMIDLLATSGGKITNLRRVTYLVLDEADRMFDMGFEPQINRIVSLIRPDRQTVMFSATFPRAVETLARAVLKTPIEIQVGGRSVVNSDITQSVEIRPIEDRFLRLLEILGDWYERGKVLVFVSSQDQCDNLFRDLLKVGYPCLSLHGGKDQSDRESTINDFKTDVCSLLIATGVAARGLDVKELVLVVNYDTPNHHEEYVHRVGRTGNKGTAITFIAPEDDRYAPDLVKALKESAAPIPKDLQALADAFNEKRKAGTVHAHGSGYGGSGFKFDTVEEEERRAARKEAAKEAAKDAGMSDDEEAEDEGTIRQVMPGETAAKELAAQAAAANALLPTDGMDRDAVQKARLAQEIAARMTQAASIQKPPAPAPDANPALSLAAVAQAAANQLAQQRGMAVAPIPQTFTQPKVPSMWAQPGSYQPEADKPHFESELEINDFPQHARWKITHRETIAQINELTGAAMTTKGFFYDKGQPVPEGERKLYLVIEGPTELSVKRAKVEIKRILEEYTEKAMRRDAAPSTGRYSVV